MVSSCTKRGEKGYSPRGSNKCFVGKGARQKAKARESNNPKKSYNPFKMWGSYVGAIGFPILVWIIAGQRTSPTGLEKIFQDIASFFTGGGDLSAVIQFALYPIVGFLIGWGIHSLFRRLRK